MKILLEEGFSTRRVAQETSQTEMTKKMTGFMNRLCLLPAGDKQEIAMQPVKERMPSDLYLKKGNKKIAGADFRKACDLRDEGGCNALRAFWK